MSMYSVVVKVIVAGVGGEVGGVVVGVGVGGVGVGVGVGVVGVVVVVVGEKK